MREKPCTKSKCHIGSKECDGETNALHVSITNALHVSIFANVKGAKVSDKNKRQIRFDLLPSRSSRTVQVLLLWPIWLHQGGMYTYNAKSPRRPKANAIFIRKAWMIMTKMIKLQASRTMNVS
jgi:hypothetical protein